MAELEKIPGVKRVFTGPVFNEFALEFPRSVKLINAELLREKIIGPLPLGTYYAGTDETRTRLRDGNDAARGNRTLRRSRSGEFSRHRYDGANRIGLENYLKPKLPCPRFARPVATSIRMKG